MSDNFAELKEQLRHGDDQAAVALLSEFGPRVLSAVRRRLGRQLRTKFDSDDFVQAVWASFFAHDGGLTRFESADALVAFLVGVASNKVAAEGRALKTAKRDPDRETRTVSDESDTSSENTPSQFAVANELWSAMLSRLSPGQRAMVELRLAGHTHVEIAERLGVTERTVRRLFKRLQRQVGPE